ncbi:MAG: PD-(D/E)XK nuclease family protein [Deltaproteobacteria bacterium]|nr:PD-(D/E)XK nuclease family protein [Deltaproteobacteria bacterium]
MPLRLRYVFSVSPYLDEILAPLIRRHIDFKLRDSFRIVTPDAESRQDLEERFLSREALGGVLIGKSLLTLHSLAQTLLLEHPAPKPLATMPVQRKALRRALSRLKPEWKLDGASLQKCLRELQGLGRLADLRTRGRTGLGQRVAAEFQRILAEDFGAWTAERQMSEAWGLLGRSRASGLELVQECWFLGFRFPEAALLDPIEALLRAHPRMEVHLFLPPPEQFLDAEGKLEPWLRRLQALAGDGESLPMPRPPRLEVRPYATPLHEARGVLAAAHEGIWTPAFCPVGPLLEAEPALTSTATQLPARILAGLAGGSSSEASMPFSALMEECVPVFQTLQETLAANGDLDSLRYLEAARRWLLDCARAEAPAPEPRPRDVWLAELKEDLLELRISAPPGAGRRLPLRRLDRPGLVRRRRIAVAGMNEGACPSPPSPAFFEEESLRFFTLHEEALAFRQTLLLAEEEATLSCAQLSLSGRALPPSSFLADLDAATWHEPEVELAPRHEGRHPYFAENASREARRHRGAESGLDSGRLSSLPLGGRILDDLLRRPLSATYLDDYAKCPWRFFAKRFLQLKEEPEEDLEIAPRRRGSLSHRLLEGSFARLIEDFFSRGNLPTHDETQAVLEAAFARLRDEVLAEESRIPRVLRTDQLERLRGTAQALLEQEQAAWSEAPARLIPRHLEWSFGRGGRPPLTLGLPGGPSLPLTGAVDRIDVSEDGGRFLLIDYKTSQTSDLAREIREGLGLQLWIYLQAVRRLLYPRAEALGGLYWDLKETKKDQGMARREAIQDYLKKKPPAQAKSFFKDEDFEALESRLEAAAIEILQKILRGDFSLAPAQCLGTRCEYREICRYDDKPRN